MKKEKLVIKVIPKYVWIISGIILAIILWLDFMVLGAPFEVIWLLGIFIISLFSLYGGFKGCFLSVAIIIFFYVLSEIIETFLHREENIYLHFFSVGVIVSVTISICIGLLTHYLRVKDRQLKEIFDNVDITIWSRNLYTGKLIISKGSEKILGYTTNAFIKNPVNWLNVIHPDDLQLFVDNEELHNKGLPTRLEYRIIRPDGKTLWIESKTTPIKNENGEVYKLIGVVMDITQRKASEKRLSEIAYEDSVTGLPNRKWFNQYLENAAKKAAQLKQIIAILMIDFDNFKKVNDTLGHSVGDDLLRDVSSRITQSLEGKFILSRQGGDEFLVLLENVKKDEINSIANKIIRAMNDPFQLEGHEVVVTLSIGVSINESYDVDAEVLLKQADIAMYLAKEKGKNNYQFYNEELNHKIVRKARLEEALRKAIINNEFTLYYQPQIDLKTEKVDGLEALLRWNSPFGPVRPDEFIPILEETGMIVEVGEWVLLEACKQSKLWHEEKGINVPIAVNVSGRQLIDEKFVDMVKRAITDTGIGPDHIEIEITESVMFDITESTAVLKELKEFGIKIAIDDFGVGFSSLNLVRNHEFDNLKIDQSFLCDVMKNERTAIILKSIIDIGKNLGTTVVVEGIETKEEAEFLKPLGVIGQGYYFSRPLHAKDVENYFDRH